MLMLILDDSVLGFGTMDSISASFGDYGLFCAIDTSGKHAAICWDSKNRNSTNSNSLRSSSNLPPMAALSGGDGNETVDELQLLLHPSSIGNRPHRKATGTENCPQWTTFIHPQPYSCVKGEFLIFSATKREAVPSCLPETPTVSL
ncbi:unnamed protein product [Fraxinus pennsylvanica]|uniref:Uncharacterized protein n=1 Tax=Fraxinus pennsylvanica TaxID=56036 RepID=A0AAD2E884_9LAMI|nr:unnamed protein product [Fraxinus pennsylvanica]